MQASLQAAAAQPDNQAPPEPEFEINLSEYVGMIRRHWKLALAIALAAIAISFGHYLVTPKSYMAQTTLLIERRSLSPQLTTQNPWIDTYNLEFYPTQYKLLESRGLAERVVRNLDLMADPALHLPASGASGVGAAPSVRAAAAKSRDLTPTSSVAEDDAMLGRLADQLRGGLAVEPVRNTQLVTLSYRSASPEFAARAANGFAEAFIDMGIEDRYASAGKTSTFLGTQIETLKKEIDQKEAKLQAFSRKTDIVTLEPGNNVTLQRLEALNANYIEAKKTRIEKEAELHQAQSTPKERLADNAAISELRAEQSKLERDYDTKLKTFKPDWPAMIELQTQIDKGRQHIQALVLEGAAEAQQAAQADYQSALRQEQSLEAEINKLKSTAMDESSDAVEYNNLKVEVKTRRDLLDELLRKQSETEVTVRLQDTRDTNVRIVDRALAPSAPFYPSLRKSLSSGLIVGLMLGMGLALLIEFMDRTIKTPEEVERRFGLPTLAVIPDMADAERGYGYMSRSRNKLKKRGPGLFRIAAGKPGAAWREKRGAPADSSHVELVPHVRPRTPIAEAYRALRTSLLLSSASELKVIAITSAEAGEGKTATTSNLAVVLAQLGMQVLVVDADLRKPRQHHIFRLSNRFGLVSYLTGTTVSPESVFLRTEVPNLWLTPSGPLPPNPSELLASDRMREWLILVRKRFDFVLVDTPPALAVTDSIIVGAVVDGVVITLRNGKVTREDARACRDRLRLAGVHLLGVVLNRYFVSHGAIGKRYRYYEAYGTYDNAPQSGPQAGSAA